MISRDEWLKALSDVEPVDDQEALTAVELADLWNIPIRRVQNRIKILITNGRAVATSKKRRDAQGRLASVVAYRLVNKEKTCNSSLESTNSQTAKSPSKTRKG